MLHSPILATVAFGGKACTVWIEQFIGGSAHFFE